MNNIRSNSNIQSNMLSDQAALALGVYNLNGDYISVSSDNDKMAYYLGDGWCTFPDLDNFDSEKLLRALTLKEKDSADSLWDASLSYAESSQRKSSHASLSVSALRQLEALFNITQLLFGLSRAETVNYTFRDLQLKKHPHSFKKSGFKHLNNDGRIDFYAIFELLVKNIIDQGALEVTLLMYRNPVLPMVRQKCLDLISNVATVPDVAYKIMLYQSWFLDHLLIMIRDGDIVSDKIPALSVLIRLLKVMLTERMISSYMKLVDMQYIDCLVDIFENPKYTESSEYLAFFIKFEFITMQSLTVILGDSEYSQFWSDKAKTRLLNYCMIVLLKAAGAYPTGGTLANQSTSSSSTNTNTVNHIFYAEQHTNKHSLAHTIMTVTELLRNDDNMKLFYRYHKPFKQLIIQLYKKYGAKSQFSRIDPGISYALNHLMRVLYIKNAAQSVSNQVSLSNHQIETLAPARVCSNPDCKNEETKYKEFKHCPDCDGKLAAYCSRKCRKTHLAFHLRYECVGSIKQQQLPPPALGRRASDLNQKSLKKKLSLNHGDDFLVQTGDSVHQSLSRTKRLSKYSSMNENHRRNSSNFVRSGSGSSKIQTNSFPMSCKPTPPQHHYTKHTGSMKEIKSSRILDPSNIRAKLMLNSRGSQQTNSNESSINFVRPLKTSTALCLTDLTRKQAHQISAISNSTSSSSSSTENSQPTTKKFKTNNGAKSNNHKSKKKHENFADYVEEDDGSANRSTHKRRHSTTASVLTTFTTTTTTRTLKTKIKSTAQETLLPSPETTNQQFFYKKQEDEDADAHDDADDDDTEVDGLEEFLSTSSSSNDSSTSSASSLSDEDEEKSDETIEKASDHDEEVEGERWATRNDLGARGSNHKVESPESSDLFANSNNSLENSNQEDEQERKSKFKVIKEFEKTLEFFKNASNLKVMPLNNNEQKKFEAYSGKSRRSNEISSLKAPHISLASLCYDRTNTTNANQTDDDDEQEEENSSDDDSTDNDTTKPPQISQPKGVNLIINNSIDSHMLTNSFNLKQAASMSTFSNQQQIKINDVTTNEDEMSLFKNETLLNANKMSDYKTFKMPLLPNLPLSLQPIQIQPNDYLLKKNKIYNELKVFNNISNFDSTTNTSALNPPATELPKNSTPIFGDNTTAAYLTAKRKQLMNAKLDLTIAPPSQQAQPAKPIERKASNFSVPKLAQFSKEREKNFFQTSTLRSTSDVKVVAKQEARSSLGNNNNKLAVPGVETKITGSLDISKLSAIENVVTSTNLVCVAKTEIPKDIKKCFKDEIKKDKTKCVIQ